MSKLIVFDFDGTLIDINHLHKQAWREVISEIGLRGDLASYLPKDRYLLERFDSAKRIRQNFLATDTDRITLEVFFGTKDERAITRFLLGLKESHLLYMLDQLSPIEMYRLYAKNIFQGIDILLNDNYRLGIISSTRESIILKSLRNCRLDDCFRFVIGEESMNDENKELHKYDPRVRGSIPQNLLADSEQPYYIGDDARMDSLLARNYNFRFLQVSTSTDFIQLKELL